MLLYLLKASILLLVLYLFYKWALEKESFFASNRLYLLGSLVLCFVLPFVSLPAVSEYQGILTHAWEQFEGAEEHAVVESLPLNNAFPVDNIPSDVKSTDQLQTTQLPQPKASEAFETVEPIPGTPETTRSSEWRDWLLYLYGFGVIVFFLHLLTQLLSILWRINRTTDKIHDSDYTIVNVSGEQAPCSFFHYILINPDQFEYEAYEEILGHELIHVRQKHSIDLLLAELVSIILWFNPMAWLFRKEVEKNIEYQTDDLCLRQRATDAERYQMNLLRIASKHHPLTVTTNYNQSLLKQRILKMNAKKSNPHSMWKFAFTVPLVLALLLLLNVPHTFGAQPASETAWEQDEVSESSLLPEEQTPIRVELTVESDSFPENAVIAISECEELEAAIMANNLERVQALLEQLDEDCLLQQTRVSREVLKSLAPLLEIGADLQIDPEGKLLAIQTNLDQLEALTELEQLSELRQLIDAAPAYTHQHAHERTHPIIVNAECEALVQAIEAQDKERVAELLKTTDPECWFSTEIKEDSYTWHTRKSPLVAAAKTGNTTIAQLLLDKGLDANFHAHGEPSPLMAAAEKGKLEMVKFLQRKGAMPDVNLDGYGTPLARAAAKGAMPVVEYLLTQDVNINASGAGVGTPLLQAARHGQDEVVRYLLQQDAQVNIRVPGVGTALSAATRAKHHSSMQLLIDAQAKVDATGAGVGTPLMEAVRNNDEKALGMLRSAGADVNVRTPGVGTALSYAAREDNARMIQLLLDAGANPDLSGAGVGTPLMLAARSKAEQALNALLAGGASLDARVDGVGTVLSEAVQYGNMSMIKRVLAEGADPDLAGAGVGTPLIMAIRNNDQATAEFLIQKGADVDASSPGVGTPLSTAVRSDNLALVKFLLAQKAAPDAAAAGIGSPLLLAIRNGNYEITKLLLENGADPNQTSYVMGYRSALDAARAADHESIIKLLEAQGAQ